MTENQRKLLFFLWKYITTHGNPPSLREMVDGIGVSGFNSISGIIDALFDKGFITKGNGKSRSVILTAKWWKKISAPEIMKETASVDIRQPKNDINSVGIVTTNSSQNIYPDKVSVPTNGTFPANPDQFKNILSFNISTPLLGQIYDNKMFSGIFEISFLTLLVLWWCVTFFGKNMLALKATCILVVLIFLIKKFFHKK